MPTVLVVDDEVAILRAIQRTLRREPCEVIAVHDFTDAVTQLSELRPRVLLTDYRMPTGTGLQLAQMAKELDPDICCILLTGCSDEESGRQLINAPAVDHVLLKPWHNEELRTLLRDLLGVSK